VVRVPLVARKQVLGGMQKRFKTRNLPNVRRIALKFCSLGGSQKKICSLVSGAWVTNGCEPLT
jgi:hypothetical protein